MWFWDVLFWCICQRMRYPLHSHFFSRTNVQLKYCSGPSVGLELPIMRPVMVEFSRPDVSESGGCWSRWWTSLPDSGSSLFSSILVIYQAGFILIRTRIFFFLAARTAAVRRIRPVRPEFQFRSSIAYSLGAAHELRTWKKETNIF